jgi:hypothetical protein
LAINREVFQKLVSYKDVSATGVRLSKMWVPESGAAEIRLKNLAINSSCETFHSCFLYKDDVSRRRYRF